MAYKSCMRVIIAFVLCLVLTIFFSYLVERKSTARDMKVMDTSLMMATKEAEQNMQVKGLTDEEYIVTHKQKIKANFEEYLDHMETAGKSVLPSSSDYFKILQFLRAQDLDFCMNSNYQSLNNLGINTKDYKSTKFSTSEDLSIYKSEIVSPLQFDLTYMDKDYLKYSIDKCLKNILSYNCGKNATKEVRNYYKISGNFQNIDANVEPKFDYNIDVKGPYLISLNGSGKEEDFESIFGVMPSSNKSTGLKINSNDPMYHYIVVYDISVEVAWAHHTNTLYFKVPAGNSVAPGYSDQNGQIILNGLSSQYKERYVIAN